MKNIIILATAFLAACGNELSEELFCEGTVEKVSYSLGDYVIDFCDGSQCIVSQYALKDDGIPSGHIQIYRVKDRRHDRQWFEAEYVPGEWQGCKKSPEQIMAEFRDTTRNCASRK